MEQSKETFFAKLSDALPPVFSREEAARHLGGILKAKTLANIDFLGEGPSVKVRIGKKVGYEKNTFIEWLQNYKAS